MQVRTFSPEELLGPLNDVEKKNAPSLFYVAGHLEILAVGARISIVGSRSASDRGLEEARSASRFFAERGVAVVSGLALGVDTEAHWAAVRAGGRTMAILGTPPDQVSPVGNRALQDLIMREHLAISQFAPGTGVRAQNFPIRNRTMALIADATLIVEARENSGTVHQGWEAIRLGRPLFFMESFAKNGVRWATEMLRYGAQAVSLADLEAILEFLPERIGVDASTLPF